jgi:multiple sugar transport system substrate-binding protein
VKWLAAGAAALILAACAGPSSSSATATLINFWYLANGAQPDQNFQEAAKAFHAEHPDIEVKGTKISSLPTSLTGANAPDVIQINRDWIAALTATGALHELSTDEVQGLGGSGAFVPSSWPSGKTTSIPWSIDMRAIYYRADILQALNIDPANAFSDWEAFDHTLDTIKTSGKIAPFGIAGRNDSHIAAAFAPWIWEAGGTLISGDGTKATINEPRSVDGVDEFQRFGGKYVDSAVLQQDSETVDALFAAGKFAVTISGPGLAAKLKTVKFGTAPFPSGHAGHVVYIGGSNLSMVKPSKAAYEWIKWLAGNEGETGYVQRLGMYPSLAAAAPQGAFTAQLKLGREFPALAAWPKIESAMATDLGKIWDNVIAEKQPMAKDQLQTLLDKTSGDMQAALTN